MEHGRPATFGQLPWHVSVGVRQNRGPALTPLEGHRGGGTIIATRWVLTAAHCLADVSDLLQQDGRIPMSRDVRVGVVRGTDLTEHARQVDVVDAWIHPSFSPATLEYDAALLQLSSDVEGGVQLGHDDVTPGDCGIVAGWGETHDRGRIVPGLSWSRMHVGSDRACARETWGRVAGNPDLMFTAGGDEFACPEFPRAAVRKGDSGGGFVVTRCGAPRLYGIVSWSAAPLTGRRGPQVLTRTRALSGWIAWAAYNPRPCDSRCSSPPA